MLKRGLVPKQVMIAWRVNSSTNFRDTMKNEQEIENVFTHCAPYAPSKTSNMHTRPACS
jgi:hypothetical protein